MTTEQQSSAEDAILAAARATGAKISEVPDEVFARAFLKFKTQGFGLEFAGFSDALGRLRIEMTIGAFICWALVSLKPNLQKLPIFSVELETAPIGTVYVLALSFFLYCAACFAVRFSREYAQYVEQRRTREQEKASATEEAYAADGYSRPTYSREPNPVEGRIKTLISFDQVVLAFIVPLAASSTLVLISLIQGSHIFHAGVVFFLEQIWAAVTLAPIPGTA